MPGSGGETPVVTTVSKPSKKDGQIVVLENLSDQSFRLKWTHTKLSTTRWIELSPRKVISIFLPAGEWWLEEMNLGGLIYKSMGLDGSFSLNVLASTPTYGGSYQLGCPKLTQAQSIHLKSMSFFNRYSFISHANTCELVVGNQLKKIKSVLPKKTQPGF